MRSDNFFCLQLLAVTKQSITGKQDGLPAITRCNPLFLLKKTLHMRKQKDAAGRMQIKETPAETTRRKNEPTDRIEQSRPHYF